MFVASHAGFLRFVVVRFLTAAVFCLVKFLTTISAILFEFFLTVVVFFLFILFDGERNIGIVSRRVVESDGPTQVTNIQMVPIHHDCIQGEVAMAQPRLLERIEALFMIIIFSPKVML